jgi:hypothetical protein
MINMKQAPEVEEMPGQIESDDPLYPYGLCIQLEADQLELLGITALPKVGSTMMIKAKAYVKSTSAYQTQGGNDMCVSLQITDMEISGEDRTQNQAEAMYGKSSSQGSAQQETSRINNISTMLYGGD